ncbi:hypothetical protein QE152_g36620 [Popillia japonica]|uniref:Uncharacterized protein n=1 Tax=Popillia japonica TaxID=7064 RepID=A0AAW1ICX5_POPJA
MTTDMELSYNQFIEYKEYLDNKKLHPSENLVIAVSVGIIDLQLEKLWSASLACDIEKRACANIQLVDTDPPPVDYVKHITVAAHLAGAAEIICEVPFASVYCHITTPYGEIFKPQSYEFTQMGQCIFSIPVVLPEHIGTWICAFAQEGQLTLDEIEVEVLITDLLVYNKELTVNSGKSLDIILKNSGSPGVPLRTCLCLTPQNISYYISETLNTSE